MANKTLNDSDFEERKSNPFVKLGDDCTVVTGKLLAIRKGNYDNELYDLETEESDQPITVAGTSSTQGKLNDEDVGKIVRFKYLGEKPSKSIKGKTYKDISVSVKK